MQNQSQLLINFYLNSYYRVFGNSRHLVLSEQEFDFDLLETTAIHNLCKIGSKIILDNGIYKELHERNIKSLMRDYLEYEVHLYNPIIYLERIVYSLTFLSKSFLKSDDYDQKLSRFIRLAMNNLSHGGKINKVYLDFSLNLCEKVLNSYNTHFKSIVLRISEFKEFLEKLPSKDKIDEIYKGDYLRKIFDNDLATTDSFDQILSFSDELKVECSEKLKKISGPSEMHNYTNKAVLNNYVKSNKQIVKFLIQNQLIDPSLLSKYYLTIRKTNSFESEFMPFAASKPPKIIGSNRSGEVLINTFGNQALHTHYKLVFAHEGVPGHFFQRISNARLTDQLTLLLTGIDWFTQKNQIKTNLFCEGWALYWEELLSKFGWLDDGERTTLDFELWRIHRLIFEIKLNTRKFSFLSAVNEWAKLKNVSSETAKKELIHYALKPSHPSSYILGKYQLLKLRKTFNSLNNVQFHSFLLQKGPLPFSLMRIN